MSVPAAEMPIRRRIRRALARGLTPERVARLYDLPRDFVRAVAAGRTWKTARRRKKITTKAPRHEELPRNSSSLVSWCLGGELR